MVCKQAEWPIKSVACLDAAISRKARLADDFKGAEILNVGAKADSSLVRVSDEIATKGDRLPILNDPEVYFKTVEIRGDGSSELARISVEHIN